MADLVPFMFFDSSGNPLTGIVPIFIKYVTVAAVIQTEPSIVEIGSGQYGFEAPSTDFQTGIIFVVDGLTSAVPRYASGVIYDDATPFAAVLLTNPDGTLYTGVGVPTFASYKDSTGANRTPPTISAVAGNYLFAFTPSAADLLVDVGWTLNEPSDGSLNIMSGGFSGVDGGSTITPGPITVLSQPGIVSHPSTTKPPKKKPIFGTPPESMMRVITIDVIDRAIRDWFDLTAAPHVMSPKNERKKVPVVMSSGERWITSRGLAGIRDKNGVLILPVISVRRTGVEQTNDQSALGTETENIQISKQIAGPKTNNLQNIYPLRQPVYRGPENPVVYEVTTIPWPHRIQAYYELMVQTQYTSQMNMILEKIFNSTDILNSFVAPFDNKNRHSPLGDKFAERDGLDGYCVGYMESTYDDRGNFEEFTDQERIIKYSTSFRVPAVLQLDPEGEKPTLRVERTSFHLNLGPEQVTYVETEEEMDAIFNKKR